MPDWMNYLLMAVIGCLSIANWIAIWKGKMNVYYATKPFVLLGLILYFFLQSTFSSAHLPFLLGLIFSLIGDVFLIPKGNRWFMVGMGAFALAQIFYIWGFNASMPSVPVQIIGAIALLAGILVMFLTVDRFAASAKVKRSILPFLKGYGILVLTMAISAMLCLARPGWTELAAVMAGTGGMLFFISDVMIGLDKLDRHLPKYRFWTIITYHIGQILIVAAVLLIPS